MRAIVVREFGPPAAMAIEDWPTPEPGPGQVRVDVRAIDVNYPDLLVIGGKYQILPPRPFVPGKAAAGVVGAARRGRPPLPARATGCWSRSSTAPMPSRSWPTTSTPTSCPTRMSFTDAAAMGLVYQTAHFALLDRGQFRAGETVLVTGAGGALGLAAIQLVKALGGIALAGTRRPRRRGCDPMPPAPMR